MRRLNKQATRIFDKITEDMDSTGYKKIDNTNGAFMPLVVEKLATYDMGTTFSLCHYFKQNGDLCQDPEMVFIRLNDGAVIPMMFQQYPGIYQESIVYNNGWKIKKRMQSDHAQFANMWLKNIKEQQRL